MPTLYIIAGCNGAGKTTAAYSLLPEVFQTVEFVNADEIARGLSPFNVEGVAFQAGKIMLERLAYLIKTRTSFAFETTLSGSSYLNFVKKAIEAEFKIVFFYVWLNTPELAKSRVAERVKKGGHDIPADVIVRRYFKSMRNFKRYVLLSNEWFLYNNSIAYELVAKYEDDGQEIYNFEVYNEISTYE